MADNDANGKTEAELRQEEQEAEERRRRGLPTLDQEIARKYDPQRLKRVVQGAGRGERLDLATRSEMERLHPGHDFSEVRVFRGALAEEVTRRHNADAVTVANTGMILVRESARSAPGTTSGRALLAHEVTHVAQAQRGLHFALEGGGGEGAHEHEARAVEHRVDGSGGSHADQASHMDKEKARHQEVIRRVFELMEDDLDNRRLRGGTDWE